MSQPSPEVVREALTPEDLNWWYGDQQRQRNTMAMLELDEFCGTLERAFEELVAIA